MTWTRPNVEHQFLEGQRYDKMTDLASSCVLGHVWGKLADRTHIELDEQIMFKINTRNHLTKYHSWLGSYRVAFDV